MVADAASSLPNGGPSGDAPANGAAAPQPPIVPACGGLEAMEAEGGARLSPDANGDAGGCGGNGGGSPRAGDGDDDGGTAPPAKLSEAEVARLIEVWTLGGTGWEGAGRPAACDRRWRRRRLRTWV